MTRFFVFKQTNDSGIAPCVTTPTEELEELLSLAICKPAIRRSARVGDYIVGISSMAIHKTDGYPLNAIIFFARIDSKVRGEDYYPRDGQADTSKYRNRIDRIYSRNEASKRFSPIPNETGHTEANMPHDVGVYSNDEEKSYKNSWVLLSSHFRYYGISAIKIPNDTCPEFLEDAKTMRQGHRVYTEASPKWHELKTLVDDLFQRETSHTQDAPPRKRARCSTDTGGEDKSSTSVAKRARTRC